MNEARILIVEDDAILAWDLETILAQEGHHIVGRAGTFENALALAEIERPDLVIMDLKLAQGTSGLATASEIYHRIGIRSLFVSGNIDRALVAKATEDCDPLGFLGKPYAPEELTDLIAASRRVAPGITSLGSPAP